VHLLRLAAVFLRVGVLNELQYRVNFFLQVFESLVALGTGLVGLALVFAHTDDLAGWSRAELLVVMGVHILMGGVILAIILLAVLLVGILFAVNNQQSMPLNLIWVELPAASLSVWLLGALACGVLLGMLAMSGVYLRLRTLLTRAQRHNQQQRKELDRLRVQELKELP